MSASRQPKTAVLLAAGRGSRLRPHTDTTPKPLLPVNGRPTLDIVLESVVRAGIERVIFVTHYLEEQIAAFVGDGSSWGIEAAFAHQSAMLGTAHALQCAIEQEPDWFDSLFLLAATDYLLPADFLRDLVAFHKGHSAEISISLKQLSAEQLIGRSSVRFENGNKSPSHKIVEIVEKPALGTQPSNFSANLIYLLPPAICSRIPKVPKSPRGEHEVQSAINQLLATGSSAYGLLQTAPSEWHPPEK